MNKTITISINDTSFEYDVRSLVRAFFSDSDVSFIPASDNPDMKISLTQDNILLEWKGTCYNTIIEHHKRPDVKNVLKILIYDVLSKSCKKALPWGTLTGVRPTKLVRGYIQNGLSLSEIEDVMYKKYRTSSGRTSIAFDISKREINIINHIEKFCSKDQTYSLYVGIPFCPSICLYCSFSSYPITRYKNIVDDYLDCLYRELSEVSEMFYGRMLTSIYIGGGTPSSLTADQLGDLMKHIAERFKPESGVEWTVEAGRADSVTKDKLLAIRQFGDIRISINPQTFNQKTLDLIGRAHTTEDVERAYYLAREVGFSNINMDIITGLPGEGETEVMHTLEKIKSLQPDNLTVHSLALKRASRLHEKWADFGSISFVNSDTIMDHVHKTADSMDMNPYYLYRQKDIAGNLENIGFAAPGMECLYNILIMEDVQDIAACGAGAISKRVSHCQRIKRAANVKGIEEYITRIEEMLKRKRDLFLQDHIAHIGK